MARFPCAAVLLWICILVPLVSCKTNLFGSFGKSVTFKCPLKPVSKIEWYDFVYSLSSDQPAQLFVAGQVVEDEYREGRVTVDINTGNLKISPLVEDDVGTYFCKTSDTDKHEFNLILAEMPSCSGQVKELHEKDQTKLECNMKYSGDSAPKLEWLREEEIIESIDMNQIGIAKQSADVAITYDMDGDNFICRAVLGEMVEECTLQFQVLYPVREPIIEPLKSTYTPGSKVTCVGKGNPTANVRVALPGGEVREGEDQVEVQIPPEWDKMDAYLFCEVDNIVDGAPAYKALNHTFKVQSPVQPGTGQSTSGDNGGTSGSTKIFQSLAEILIAAVFLVVFT